MSGEWVWYPKEHSWSMGEQSMKRGRSVACPITTTSAWVDSLASMGDKDDGKARRTTRKWRRWWRWWSGRTERGWSMRNMMAMKRGRWRARYRARWARLQEPMNEGHNGERARYGTRVEGKAAPSNRQAFPAAHEKALGNACNTTSKRSINERWRHIGN